MQTPVFVINANTQREQGSKARHSSITAAKAVASILRTTLGPQAMMKMILDPMGGIVLTNDGNAILREIDVTHPAAKNMIDLSRTQDEEVGDGTTSVIVLAGEILQVAEPFLNKRMHPTVIVGAFTRALDDALGFVNESAIDLDLNDRASMLDIVRSTIGTKFVSRFGDLMCNLALDAVMCVASPGDDIDIKRFVRIEKIPGGELSDCRVLDGVMFEKDITHPKMRRRIEKPRILLLDCPLEYKKLESQANIEVTTDADWSNILKQEEQYVEKLCQDILAFKPDLVITEKGISDIAQHFFIKAGVSAIRRIRKTYNDRIARAVGATIVSRTDSIREEDIGTGCGLFEIRKIGDEYFAYVEQCENPKACTVILRGASKDVLNEIDRNLQDAMCVARNIVLEPRVVTGGGATEMRVSYLLHQKAKSIMGIEQWPYKAVADALEVIPRTLAENCGSHTIRLITELRAKHAAGDHNYWGIDGNKGVLADMNELKIFEPLVVKTQTIKTAIESACMILRVDDIISGIGHKDKKDGQGKPQNMQQIPQE